MCIKPPRGVDEHYQSTNYNNNNYNYEHHHVVQEILDVQSIREIQPTGDIIFNQDILSDQYNEVDRMADMLSMFPISKLITMIAVTQLLVTMII